MSFQWEVYKELNPDLFQAGLRTKNDYINHYIIHGKSEGRKYSITSLTPDFDHEVYRLIYSDLANMNNIQLELHWIKWGKNEGRQCNIYQICPQFNHYLYRLRYSDLVNMNDKQLELHWIKWGRGEGRICNISQVCPEFNHEIYRSTYPDLSNMNNIQLEVHWLQWGKNEGRICSVIINDIPKIIVYTYNYNSNFGGIVSLYNLAKLLNDRGIRTKLFILNWNNKINPVYNDRVNTGEIREDTIVIYPELIEGNPLGAKNVVRWILLEMNNSPKRLLIPKTWGPNDLVYHWETKDNTKQLCIPWYNPIFKNNSTGPRDSTCYIVKKGSFIHSNIEYIHPKDSICIDDINDLEHINSVFNKCKYFYCYDPNCAFTIFAACCGCIPIVYPINGLSAEDYFKTRMFNYNGTIYNKGIVYGNNTEDINRASEELSEVEEGYKLLFNRYLETVDRFIGDINSWNNLVNKVQNEY